jgi:hypothetical protein
MVALIGVILIELFVVSAVALYVDCRRPKPPFWANDTVLYVVVGPAVVVTVAIGAALVINAAYDWKAEGISVNDIPMNIVSLVVTALLIFLLRPRRRLARYAFMRPAAPSQVTNLTSVPRLGTDRDTDPHVPKAA